MTWRWEGGIELDGSVRFRRKTSLLKQFINRTLIQVRSANFILLLFFQLMRLLSSFSQRLIEQFLWKWPVHSHQYRTIVKSSETYLINRSLLLESHYQQDPSHHEPHTLSPTLAQSWSTPSQHRLRSLTWTHWSKNLRSLLHQKNLVRYIWAPNTPTINSFFQIVPSRS
jgi:hypothetical protein